MLLLTYDTTKPQVVTAVYIADRLRVHKLYVAHRWKIIRSSVMPCGHGHDSAHTTDVTPCLPPPCLLLPFGEEATLRLSSFQVFRRTLEYEDFYRKNVSNQTPRPCTETLIKIEITKSQERPYATPHGLDATSWAFRAIPLRRKKSAGSGPGVSGFHLAPAMWEIRCGFLSFSAGRRLDA